MKKKIKDYLDQKNEKIITKKECEFILDLSTYEVGTNLEIREDEGIIFVPSLVSVINFNDSILNVTLDYPILITINSTMTKTEDEINIKFKPNDVIFQITNEDAGNAGSEISYIDRLIGGREILKDELHLYHKLFSFYKNLVNMDSIHIEVLESQVLRDSENIDIPARLGKTWNPTLVNLKTTVFSEGFIQGLSFENIGKAISNGLVDTANKAPSILEQVTAGELIEPTRKRG